MLVKWGRAVTAKYMPLKLFLFAEIATHESPPIIVRASEKATHAHYAILAMALW